MRQETQANVPPAMRRGQLHSGGIPDRVLDVLVTDGGWLTTQGVCLLFDEKDEETVRTALGRLKRRGFVVSRPRENNETYYRGQIRPPENEWKAAETP